MSFFNLEETNEGFCRVVFNVKNDKDEKIFYCFQDEGENAGGIQLYRCNIDPVEGGYEPAYKVKINAPIVFAIFDPKNKLEEKVYHFIDAHPQMFFDGDEIKE
jgi:hypothetical protein